MLPIFHKCSHFRNLLIQEMNQGFDLNIVQFQRKNKAMP